MNLTSSSMLLTLAVTSGFGCGLIKINGKSYGSGPSLTSTSGPTGADSSDASPAGSSISLPSTGGAGGKTLADLPVPSDQVPVTSWMPAQQYLDVETRSGLGFHGLVGSLALADELGAKLSHLGRISLVKACIGRAEPEVRYAIRWALCGDDVRAVDLASADAELRAAGIGGEARKELMDASTALVANAMKLGAVVELAAKDDPGIAAILAVGKAARAEWKDYASTHPDVIANVRAMQGAARVGKAKGFVGCAEKTRPAFEKVVRAKKFINNDHRDPLVYYVGQLRADLDSHLVTLAYAACAAGLDESAQGFYAAIGNGETGEVVLRGERSLVYAKLTAPSFKPKFDDRKLSLSDLRGGFDGAVMVPVSAQLAIQTPSGGDIAKVTQNGEKTTLTFKGEQVEKCLEWRETNKIDSVRGNGDVRYQQECVRREWVPSQTDNAEISTMFAAGIAPGMTVVTVNNFPVAAWTTKKSRTVLGVALK